MARAATQLSRIRRGTARYRDAVAAFKDAGGEDVLGLNY